MAATLCLVTSAAGLVYAYGGYALLLWLLAQLARRPDEDQTIPNGNLPKLSVYVAMLNEEANVVARLRNLLSQDYPRELVEILVLSDGSTDGTVERAKEFARLHPDYSIRVIHSDVNQGKACVQNLAAAEASHPILVSTDAETRFDPQCLRHLASAFSDERIGVAGGHLIFQGDGGWLERGQAMYRRMEHLIRSNEDRLGIMTRVDAVCMAYRLSIWEHLNAFEDADQVLTLIARKKGYGAKHVGHAICYDSPNANRRQEIRARERMTRKTLMGIQQHWGLRDCVAHPFFSWAIISHKLVRLLSPAFLGLGVLGIALAMFSAWGWETGVGALVAQLALGAAILTSEPSRCRILGLPQAFLIANVGFLRGWWAFLRRDRRGTWVPTSQIRG